FFFSSRRRHTRSNRDWSSDVCSSDLLEPPCPGKGYAGVCRGRAILAGGHLVSSLWGLKTRAPRKLVANKQCCSREEQDVLVSKLVIDVTDFSRPGVAALRSSHMSKIPLNACLRYSFVKPSDFHSINSKMKLTKVN